MKFFVFAVATAAFASAIATPATAFAANDTSSGSLRRAQTIEANKSGGAPRGGDPIVFDSFTTATVLTTTTGSPRTVLGGAFSVAGSGPQVDISALSTFVAATAAGTFTNLRVNVQFWNTYTAAGTPVFSLPASGLLSVDLGPVTFAANTFVQVDLTLPTPIRLNSLANKGIAISYQVDSGAGLVTTDTVTSLLAGGGGVSVGTWVLNGGNGFFRNASNRTDYNFLSSDLRTFTTPTDTAVALILNGNATVPVSLQSYKVD